jgi:multisubunit Na+/H+ antiporter MnhB subunit
MTIASPILRTVARFAVPLTLAVSVVIFMQGHNAPGGGFIAGVLGAAAGAMYLMAFGLEKAAHFKWWKVSVVGLLISVGKGASSFFMGEGFMNHTAYHLPIIGEFATAAVFDLGVYLIVVGTLMTIFVELGLEKT